MITSLALDHLPGTSNRHWYARAGPKNLEPEGRISEDLPETRRHTGAFGQDIYVGNVVDLDGVPGSGEVAFPDGVLVAFDALRHLVFGRQRTLACQQSGESARLEFPDGHNGSDGLNKPYKG